MYETSVFETVGWEWQYTPFTPILLAAGSIMASIGVYAWQNREITGASSFAALMVGTALWAITYAFQLAGANEAMIGFWADANHVGVTIVPVAWFCFTLQFAARDRWLNRRMILGLSVVPAVYLWLVSTNRYHHLVREPIETKRVADGTLVVSQHEFGIAFWAHAAYSYTLMAVGVLVLTHLLFWSPRVYRRQVGLLIVGAAIAGATNVLYHAGFGPLPYVDLTAFSFTISGFLFFLAIYHYRLFDLTPVARSLIVDTLQDGMIVLNTDDRVVDINGSAGRLLAVDPEDVIGDPFESLFPDDGTFVDPTRYDPSERTDGGVTTEPDSTTEPSSETSRTKVPPSHLEFPSTDESVDGGPAVSSTPADESSPGEAEFVVDRGATRRHLRLTSTPVHGVGDDLLGRSILVRDVTETRRLQAEVEETLDRLRRSNTELESFAGVVSHDLREPLRTIEQSLSIVEPNADELDPEHTEFVRVARENAQRAQRMIADLLAYSKIERETNELGPVDCDRLVTEVLDGLRFEIDDRNATVDVDELPTVYGVDHLLRRLFQNLLTNALEYSGDEPPEITVSGERDGSTWVFTVQDSGVGIAPEYADRVFDLFERGDRTNDGGGTGMGLAICEKIVAIHDGRIDVDSTPGVGTSITFEIPIEPPTE
ncbi:histidine kinase N-terminal 7TM domain-containing protein [Natrialba sp. INN-245]|uniref:histidine kinase N-terminal 7TM domain-containing protein n=1 Tax=Natrialba sp. INN-245 TaxID=2690967 RepID=UPI001313D010|nr:PAS domain-containing protein [Natrialba sp. INN-245]